MQLSAKLIPVLVLVLCVLAVGEAGAIQGIWTATGATMPVATLNATSTVYIGYHQNPLIVNFGTEPGAQSVVPFSGTAINVICQWGTAAQAGGLTFTLRDNASNTPVTFTATSGVSATTAATATFKAGDLLDWQAFNNNASNASGTWRCSFTY